MTALLFPSLDTLRLVLASGMIPSEITDAPARARIDEQGRVRIEPFRLPARELLLGLARLGIRTIAELPTFDLISCWAELLPLRRQSASSLSPPDIALVQLPHSLATPFVAELRRQSDSRVAITYFHEDRVWITIDHPPLVVLLRTLEQHPATEIFTHYGPNLWVRMGWEHPLPERLHGVAQATVLLRGETERELVDRIPPPPSHDDFSLGAQFVEAIPPCGTVPIPVALRLARTDSSKRETLWIYSQRDTETFWELCRSSDERILKRLEIAVVDSGSRVLVRGSPATKRPSILPAPAVGYRADDRIAHLFYPHGWLLKPEVRPNELCRLFAVSPQRLTWIEGDTQGRICCHHVPLTGFRPLMEIVSHQTSEPNRLTPELAMRETFPLERIAVQDDAATHPSADSLSEQHRIPLPKEQPTSSATGWWVRSLEKIGDIFRRPRETPAIPPATNPERRSSSNRRKKNRDERDAILTSAETLLHGPVPTSRRQSLEAGLLADFPSLTPEERTARWSELAAVYGSTGNPADAAVCWMNAVWEMDSPPVAWLDHWQMAECRAAKLNDWKVTIDRLLSEPGRFGMGRVLAASVVAVARQGAGQITSGGDLPAILAFLDHHFDDLPARSAWLARLALARISQGDTLGLARWRDRILERLRDRGPGLDLDEPSFLRFHGTAAPERFQTARTWLTKSRGMILGWVAKLGSSGRLQWAGLDAETECTGAYAQLLLAWGLGHLGERTRSRDWTARARKVLTRAVGLGVDPDVHRFLSDLFVHRIRDAQEGRQAKPGLPVELVARYEQLTDFSRYAADKLRRFVRILGPVDRVHEYREREYRPFWGYDQLGERLSVFADRTNPTDRSEEVRQLLESCAAKPTSDNIPRIALALLESAPILEPAFVPNLLHLVVPALECLEAWIQAGRWVIAEQPEVLQRFQARLLESAFAAATRTNHFPAIRPIVDYLLRSAAGEPLLRQSIAAVSSSIFRTLRKLGYGAESEELLHLLDPARGVVSAANQFVANRLGMAVGWFAVGDEEAGNRILNEARDRLFLRTHNDERETTELAIAYANALGFAPPRIALGRLEELFQRLDRVTSTGSTNRYFTLKPLELIDAVVRAVVTEDFALGTAVRGWMDDDEFLIRQRIHRDMAEVIRADEAATK